MRINNDTVTTSFMNENKSLTRADNHLKYNSANDVNIIGSNKITENVYPQKAHHILILLGIFLAYFAYTLYEMK